MDGCFKCTKIARRIAVRRTWGIEDTSGSADPPWTERENFLLMSHRHCGYSYREIARILGRDEKSVRSHGADWLGVLDRKEWEALKQTLAPDLTNGPRPQVEHFLVEGAENRGWGRFLDDGEE